MTAEQIIRAANMPKPSRKVSKSDAEAYVGDILRDCRKLTRKELYWKVICLETALMCANGVDFPKQKKPKELR